MPRVWNEGDALPLSAPARANLTRSIANVSEMVQRKADESPGLGAWSMAQVRASLQGLPSPTPNPGQDLRFALMREALFAPFRSPAVMLALAVGWSTGTPAPNDPERSAPHKTPVALNSAVLSCLARADLSRRSFYLARFLDMAEALFRAY